MNDRGAVVVCFAVPDESRWLVVGLNNIPVLHDENRHPLPAVRGNVSGRTVTVVHTGVGASPTAREHLAHVLADADFPPHLVISAGYAGALGPDLVVGDLVLGTNVSSPVLLREASVLLADQRFHVGELITVPEAVETAVAKAALRAATGALAVDMETAWIAGLCATAGVPLLSLRVVSDAADQDFPVPGRVLYDAVRQRPRYLALPLWLALHPGRIAPFVRFVRGLGPARERLTRALRTVLARL